jgi:hypothetical protein
VGGPRILRSTNAAGLIELSLVSAVATVLVIRLVLEIMGYPQLGGGGLHIGHVLYGGLIMFLSLLLLFSVMNPAVPWLAAFAGGVGFGFFIDEVGKFISEDVNYFFEPAVAVIYTVFMVLFVALSRVRRWESAMTPQDALANALSLLRADPSGGMTADTRDRIRTLLDRSDPTDPLVGVLRAHVDDLAVDREFRRSPDVAAREWLAARYRGLVRRRHFETVVIVVAVGYFLTKVPLTIRVQTDTTGVDHDASNAAFAHVMQLAAAVASGVCVAIGALRLRRSRASAYRWFLRAVLISIFVFEVFAFYYAQFAALGSLAVDLLLYAALGYMIGRERSEAVAAERAGPGAVPAPLGVPSTPAHPT